MTLIYSIPVRFPCLHPLSPPNFTDFHPPSPNLSQLHPHPPTFTHLHLISPTATHPISPNSTHLHPLPPIFTNFHPPTPTPTDLHIIPHISTHFPPLAFTPLPNLFQLHQPPPTFTHVHPHTLSSTQFPYSSLRNFTHLHPYPPIFCWSYWMSLIQGPAAWSGVKAKHNLKTEFIFRPCPQWWFWIYKHDSWSPQDWNQSPGLRTLIPVIQWFNSD